MPSKTIDRLKSTLNSFTTSSSTSSSSPSTSSSSSYKPVLTKSTLNPSVIQAEYAVRGEIALKAEELRKKLADGGEGAEKELGFGQVVNCNIGNPQQLGQKPLTFVRQVAALMEYPELMEDPAIEQLFPSDAIARAKRLLEGIGSVGAYSHSKGAPVVRDSVVKFLEERDGFPADPEDIYLTAGASAGVSNILQMIIASPSCGVMIPIPQYPLYTAALALNNARPVPYYLDEANTWALNVKDLKAAVDKARKEGTDVRAIVVIQPGNPTGNCLTAENLTEVAKFAHSERLVLLADEVYQTNIYQPDSRPFHSFKKIVRSLPSPLCDELELISYHSISKGQIGECGRRGGYFELVNISPEVKEQIYKLASIQLCPPLQGQVGVEILVNPPKEGEPSFAKWDEEVRSIQQTLKGRNETLYEAFKELEGVDCQPAEGALYLFPQITLPTQSNSGAERPPDAEYCLSLLEKTGICVVPGSGFGQKEGTFHFRTTILAPGTEDYVKRFKEFHEGYMKEIGEGKKGK